MTIGSKTKKLFKLKKCKKNAQKLKTFLNEGTKHKKKIIRKV